MEIAQLNLPARYTAQTHFKTCYAAAQFAADELTKLADEGGRVRAQVSTDDTQKLLRLLREANSAATALNSLLAGNPAPKRGE